MDLVQDVVLPQVEIAAEKLVNEKSDELVHALIAKLVEVCPVDLIDQILVGFEPKAKEVVKAELLKLVEKISDKV